MPTHPAAPAPRIKHHRLRALVVTKEQKRRLEVALAFEGELREMNRLVAYWEDRALRAERVARESLAAQESIVGALIGAGVPDVLELGNPDEPLSLPEVEP